MTSTIVRGLARLAAGVAVVVACVSCQDLKSVIVVNECGREVQATARSSPLTSYPEWVALAAGATEDIRQVPEDATEVFIRVRVSATDDPINFSIPVDASTEADIEVTLRGDRCPDA